MKKNKLITKKEIQAAIKSANPTAICRAYFLAKGERPSCRNTAALDKFLKEYAASEKQRNKAFSSCVRANTKRIEARIEDRSVFPFHNVANDLREEMEMSKDPAKRPYLKTPIVTAGGDLVFAAPDLKVHDYNVWRTYLTTKRNPLECLVLVSLGAKYIRDVAGALAN